MARRFVPLLGNICARQKSFLESLLVSVRHISQHSKTDREGNLLRSSMPQVNNGEQPSLKKISEAEIKKYSSDDELNIWNWKLEDTWLAKALEPAVQMFKRGLSKEYGDSQKIPASSRSLAEILSHIQRNKAGIQEWSLADLTVGLYLVYLRQSSVQESNDVKGVLMSSDRLVQDLIYHIELAKGAYQANAAGIARRSMLRERNILKFVKNSSVMRPGYYIGIDIRNKLVVLGIRGTHTVSDIITDILSSSDQQDLYEGFSTHFGTAEAARWFLHHEITHLRECLKKHQGFKLRLVGHSLGGAVAALFAIMLRRMSKQELGFDPSLVSAVGFGTPPCLSKNLSESCADYVSTVIMQDDIVPQLSTSSLMLLRNEIIKTDWTGILKREDWRTLGEWVANAKQAASLVQGVTQKLSHYTKLSSNADTSVLAGKSTSKEAAPAVTTSKNTESLDKEKKVEELFLPGTLYYLKKQMDIGKAEKHGETYELWRMRSNEHFPRILLSGNLILDHKCDSHYYALRDVLKGLPTDDHL